MSARLLLVVLLGLAGCTSTPEAPAGPESAPEPPSLEALRADPVVPGRASFCELVAADEVSAAIGGVARTRHYDNGARVRLAPGVRDVAHEFGCTYVGTDGQVARAWVFAPPVTRGQARNILAGLGGRDCTELPARGFGRPGAGLLCAGQDGRVASYHGLFGDAWFGCSLTGSGSSLPTDAERWCVATVTAAAS